MAESRSGASPYDAAAYHATALETMPERYTLPVRLRLELGRYVLAEDYARALVGREQLVEIHFTPDDRGTRVELTHSGWEQLGDAARKRIGQVLLVQAAGTLNVTLGQK